MFAADVVTDVVGVEDVDLGVVEALLTPVVLNSLYKRRIVCVDVDFEQFRLDIERDKTLFSRKQYYTGQERRINIPTAVLQFRF